MRCSSVLLVRRPIADVAAHGDERRPGGLGLGRRQGGVDGRDVVAVAHPLCVPAVGVEPRAHVLGEGDVGAALDGDVVVVVEDDELAETQVPGQRGGLRGHALHHAAVALHHVGEMVDDRVTGAIEASRQSRLGDGHADGVGEALAQRPGRGLHARRQAVLRMAGRAAAPLAEGLDLVERQVEAAEMQERVQKHAAVAGREDEAVTVRPRRVGRVHLQMPVQRT